MPTSGVWIITTGNEEPVLNANFGGFQAAPGPSSGCGEVPAVIPTGEVWFKPTFIGGNPLFPLDCAGRIGTVATIAINFSTLNIYLDNNPTPLGINQLPSGFLISGYDGIGSVKFRTGIRTRNNFNSNPFIKIEITCTGVTPFSGYQNEIAGNLQLDLYSPGPNYDDPPSPSIYSLIGLKSFLATLTVEGQISGGDWFFRFNYKSAIANPYYTSNRINFNGEYVIWSADLELVVSNGIVTINDPSPTARMDAVEFITLVDPDDPTDIVKSEDDDPPVDANRIRILPRNPLTPNTILEFQIISPAGIVINPILYLNWLVYFTFYATPIVPTILYPGYQVYVAILPPAVDPIPTDTLMFITGSGGAEFDGEAAAVVNVDTSGLYFINPTKTNDTLYLREELDSDPVDTEVVKIPNPKIKLGYLGG